MRHEHSDVGPTALMLVIEPNDTEHQVRCLCRNQRDTELADWSNGQSLQHLTRVYGGQVIVALARHVTLSTAP